MRKKCLLFVVTTVMVLATGCGSPPGISQSSYDAVVSERDMARAELEELKGSAVSQEKYDAVVSERDTARAELDELKSSAVSQDEYDAVVSERDELQKKIEEVEVKEKEEAEKKAENEAKKSAEKAEEEHKTVKVGDSFKANGLKISIKSSDLEYWTYDPYYDGQVYGRGMKYVGVTFSVKNVGDSERNITRYDFDCYADNSLCDSASFDTGGYGSISSGRKTSFGLYWKVPEDAKTIEIEYKYYDGLFNKNKIKIKLK